MKNFHRIVNILHTSYIYHRNISNCNDAFSFCGLRNQKYPDQKPMGYPFNKNTHFNTLRDFTEQISNATLGQCTIRFTDQIISQN